MFVSSYNTYIHTNTTDKTAKSKESTPSSSAKSFQSQLLNSSQTPKPQTNNTPINYVESSKVFQNKQKLQQNIESKNELTNVNKFNTFSSLKTAKVAYTDNSKIFSIVAKPKPSLPTTHELTKENEFSKQKDKFNAINTYLKNDLYYQITA